MNRNDTVLMFCVHIVVLLFFDEIYRIAENVIEKIVQVQPALNSPELKMYLYVVFCHSSADQCFPSLGDVRQWLSFSPLPLHLL